jgi:hypothetical protein
MRLEVDPNVIEKIKELFAQLQPENAVQGYTGIYYGDGYASYPMVFFDKYLNEVKMKFEGWDSPQMKTQSALTEVLCKVREKRDILDKDQKDYWNLSIFCIEDNDVKEIISVYRPELDEMESGDRQSMAHELFLKFKKGKTESERNYFKDFDFQSFWDNSEYAKEKYICEPFTEEVLYEIQHELGYKLPDSYIRFMSFQNGGIPICTIFRTSEPTSSADDYFVISGIHGIGREKEYSLCGDLGSQFMIDEWEYPEIGVYISDCPSAGHELVALDYRKNGPNGEPEVVHVYDDHEITFLANNFEEFVYGLMTEEEIKEPTCQST